MMHKVNDEAFIEGYSQILDSKKVGILAFVPDLYTGYPMSRHHILNGLSQVWKVLWVSPPLYWLPTLQGHVYPKGRGVHKISERLWSYAPLIPADYADHYSRKGIAQSLFRQYAKIWDRLFIRKVQHLLHSMSVEDVILYIWRPEFGKYVGKFSEILTCYHIVDEYSFNPSVDEPISSEELTLLSGADIIFIHSKTLMQKKGDINKNTFYLPNGVDFEHFERVLRDRVEEPQEISSIPHPRIGYIGHIKRHLDLPLLQSVAKERPHWSFVFVGPMREEHRDIKDEVFALQQLPNVYFIGGKPALVLPVFINAFDVCLMPYRQTFYTRYIYPLKLHEYLACGKPVVGTPLANLMEFEDILYFADSEEQWVNAIEQALSEDNHNLQARRVEIARQNSWASRVEIVASVFHNALQERN